MWVSADKACQEELLARNGKDWLLLTLCGCFRRAIRRLVLLSRGRAINAGAKEQTESQRADDNSEDFHLLHFFSLSQIEGISSKLARLLKQRQPMHHPFTSA
jgi:hypothetical protein